MTLASAPASGPFERVEKSKMVRHVTLAVVGVAALVSPALAATPCADLKSLKLANTTITLAEPVAAGPFVQPGRAGGPPPRPLPRGPAGRGGAPAAPPLMLPALLPRRRDADAVVRLRHQDRSVAALGRMERQVPGGRQRRLGRHHQLSGDGAALREGYATSSTDTGHVGGTSAPLIGHPEKVIDYSHRAVHEMAATAKKLIDAHYDQQLRLSYWNGCSTGGRQGLMSAQRFPEDFDAILAGAPANYHSHLHSNDLVNAVPALTTPGGAAAAGEAEHAEPGGAQRLRRAGRRQGRPAEQPQRVQVRRGDARLQGRGRPRAA